MVAAIGTHVAFLSEYVTALKLPTWFLQHENSNKDNSDDGENFRGCRGGAIHLPFDRRNLTTPPRLSNGLRFELKLRCGE
jgi:hypothetical protein